VIPTFRSGRRPAALALLLVTAAAATAACGDDDDDATGPSATVFAATLAGANERPNPVTTAASGSATVTVSGQQATYVVNFSGLSATPIGGHIHAPAGPGATAPIIVPFPLTGVTSGTGTLTGTITAANIQVAAGQTAAVSFDSLVTLMRTGNAYVNLHTPTNQPGEIRGQLAVRP